MRGFGGSTLRGGQTVFHSIRMWGQLFQAAMLFAAFMTVAVPAWNLWNRTTGAEWYAAGMFTLAEFKLTVGYAPDSGQEIRFADGTTGVMKIRDIVASMPAWRARERIKAEMFRSAWLGAKVGAGIIALFLGWFWYRGVQLSRRKRIRGAELVTAGELRRRMRPAHLRVLDRMPGAARLRPYSIAGIPYPERTETQHTIVSGTTGSGKTVLIADLVSQIRARGERCVIYDKMGSYTRSFFDPARDVLMNPLDARAPRWSPFLEARNPRDFDMMAAALIPQQKDTVDPFWVTAARQLFFNGAGVFWKKGVTENKVLVDHLLKTDLTALAKAMEGTVAQSIVDPENPKTALSVRAMLTAHLGALEFLPDTGKPFSIRDWIGKEDKDGFLFLTSRGDQHASLRGLISTWLEIAVNAMVTLAQDDGRRIWVILDELPTLHQVPSLQPGLAESRQFGGCFVLGVQVAAALRDLYGRNGAETISGLCGIVQHQQPGHARGKNAADIALVIDAMDLMYRERLDGFVLVSSDSDFTRLAQRLREGGFAVYGFGDSMLSTIDLLRGLSAGAGLASPDASGASAGLSAGAGSSAVSSSTPPVSNAANPGMVHASAAACAVAPIPTGGVPAANASSIAVARSAFLYFDRAEAQAVPSVWRATSRMRSFLMRDHSMSAVGRTCFAKSMSSRATVASSSGRAPCSKASWPFTVRATAAANSFSLSARGSARSAAKQAAPSSPSIHSKGWWDQSASIASPGLQAAKSSSFVRVVGRSAVSSKAMSSACEGAV